MEETLNCVFAELNVIQKRNGLNKVIAADNVGPGNAHHVYKVIKNDGSNEEVAEINFQCGPRNVEGSTHGVLDGDLLEMVRDRLTFFQAGEFACRENEQALLHVEEALMWMNMRAENRAARNVLGTYNK